MSQYLFVYGTLMDGMENEFSVPSGTHLSFLGEACFYGHLFDIGGYPGAIPDNTKASQVSGEVYLLNDSKEFIIALDKYEGTGPSFDYPTEYLRQEVDVMMDSGESLRCWAYIYNRTTDGLKRIKSGDFRYYMKHQCRREK